MRFSQTKTGNLYRSSTTLIVIANQNVKMLKMSIGWRVGGQWARQNPEKSILNWKNIINSDLVKSNCMTLFYLFRGYHFEDNKLSHVSSQQ